MMALAMGWYDLVCEVGRRMVLQESPHFESKCFVGLGSWPCSFRLVKELSYPLKVGPT
jgi:hypothetical protein